MADALGWRKKFGVIAPSTNTVVQPEFDAMRPRGVTNHFGRIHIPNNPLRNDGDFTALIETVRGELLAAIDRVMTCEPDHLIMGMSSETFWDGLEGSERLRASRGTLRRPGNNGLGRLPPGIAPIWRHQAHRRRDTVYAGG
jgi:maleate isomerase